MKSKSTEEDFAEALKDLCRKFNIGELDCFFKVLIEDHSISHERRVVYKNAVQNEGNEYSNLTIVERKNI